MAKRSTSTRKTAARSTKTKAAGRTAVLKKKPARPAKSAALRSAKSSSCRRSGRKSRRSAGLYVERLKRWRKECLARIRHIPFDKLADFCKKEVKELVALAGRINGLANPQQPARQRKAK
jgi:hypothetical protein